MIIRPSIFKNENIIAAQSTRLGGVSPAPFSSMNLGLSVNDTRENVMKNRELFFKELGIKLDQLAISRQVHGNDVQVVNEPTTEGNFDAKITNKRKIFLVISVADCTPILIYDTKNKAVAAIHAGWRGTVGKIVTNTLLKMKEHYSTHGADCKAYIGACIAYENFEVDKDVAQHFDTAFKRFDTVKEKYFVDLKKANSQQLIDLGVYKENIEISNYCSVQNNDLFFSHRKEKGITGRMMAVIGMF
ncbi:MAG: peptidoglycan editing factor PgeF [Bacteroidota bacterium]